MRTWMNTPTSFETRTIEQRKSMHIKEELTEDLVQASTAIDNSNGINKPNSAATIVENEAVVEPVQANTTIINCTPHPTEKKQSVLVQVNMTIITCTPHPTKRQQSANPKYLNNINIGIGQKIGITISAHENN